MKRIAYAIAALLAAASLDASAQQKVLARFVPERADDFVWENELVAYRVYGKALEGNPTSPGFDVWVKLPGKLVANDWYAHSKTNPGYYHRNHGGKDCYKVSTSLGAGASAVIVDGKVCYPATNYRSWEVLEQSDEKVVFSVSYPEWEIGDLKVALTKKITVVAGTFFCKCEDTYTFTGADKIQVAAGIYRHKPGTIESELKARGTYAIWEHASDQSAEPEDGMIGVAIKVPGAKNVAITEDGLHGLLGRTVKSGETFSYSFGSCWSKGDITSAEQWFKTVKKAK